MLKKTYVKQQGKMSAPDILHACAFIFYFEKWNRFRVFWYKNILALICPGMWIQIQWEFLWKGFFFSFANSRQTDLETKVVSDDASASHFWLGFVYFLIIACIVP